MSILNVKSEIGKLKKVVLHRPGKELENLTPKWLSKLLFDDIPWLEEAQHEHDLFADELRKHQVEVYYLENLVSEALDVSDEIKKEFINLFIKESLVYSESLKEKLFEYLNSFNNNLDLVKVTMSGIKKTDLPNYSINSLADYIRDYPFITDPMPNLYFTRDPFTVIDGGVSINHMQTITRNRETIYGHFIFKYHPEFRDETIVHFYDRNLNTSIEGGDILVLSKEVIAIGVSERTHPASIERLAKNIFYNSVNTFTKVLAFDIPKTRAFMHLDTVFTQVDHDKFLIHNGAKSDLTVYELSKTSDKLVKITQINGKLSSILEKYLNKKITLISCGGDDEIASDREQWNDGANSLAIAPGEVIVYSRNKITNEILKEKGIKVYPIKASELSRGRGGPRCMSMPLYREDL